MPRMDTRTDQSAAPGSARILMVDDDPGIRDVVSDFLGKHGYQVETAADSREMEQALERGPVDLIVLDVMLPGEDGLAICRRLAVGEAPPIIMLSAMGEDTDRIVGLELGASDYLPKPCNPRELLARIRAVLRRGGDRPKSGGQAVWLGAFRLDRVHAASPRTTSVASAGAISFKGSTKSTSPVLIAALACRKTPKWSHLAQ